jgi:hypothetical protein
LRLGDVEAQFTSIKSITPAEGWYGETILVVSDEHAWASARFNETLNTNPKLEKG